MPMTEIEFDLSPVQFALMGYPRLQQGHTLTLQLESRVLAPDGDEFWYHVQAEELAPQLVRVGRGLYAFAGQIQEAYINKSDGYESAVLLVQCGEIPLRLHCGPQPDGRLPYGTWETRYVTGYSTVAGVVEESFEIPIGKQVTVTLWSFRRLVLAPGDAKFGEWHESDDLLPVPYQFDRVVVTARVHRPIFG